MLYTCTGILQFRVLTAAPELVNEGFSEFLQVITWKSVGKLNFRRYTIYVMTESSSNSTQRKKYKLEKNARV